MRDFFAKNNIQVGKMKRDGLWDELEKLFGVNLPDHVGRARQVPAAQLPDLSPYKPQSHVCYSQASLS